MQVLRTYFSRPKAKSEFLTPRSFKSDALPVVKRYLWCQSPPLMYERSGKGPPPPPSASLTCDAQFSGVTGVTFRPQ